MHGDWVTAIAAIIGAIIGVAGTLIIEYFRTERKAVRFIIDTPEDLAAALRSHGSSFELKVNNVATQTLVAAGITVQNTGNVIITDFTFDVGIPGGHALAQAQPVSENMKLAGAIRIDQGVNPVRGLEHQPLFAVSLAYFNPGETFKVATFYDGDMTRCTVDCRLPGVKIKMTTQEDADRRTAAVDEATRFLAKVGVPSGVAGLAALVTALIALTSH